jgi:hypothetical protein
MHIVGEILNEIFMQPTKILKQTAVDTCHTSERIFSEMRAILSILLCLQSQKSAYLIYTTAEA